MELFIAGLGNVGSALRLLMISKGCNPVCFSEPGWEQSPPQTGILFLTMSDSQTKQVLETLYDQIPDSLRIIYCAAGMPVDKKNLFLLHPYASISPETELTALLWTLCGGHDRLVHDFLSMLGIRFISLPMVSAGYHTSAVLCGNFVQLLIIAARELLEREGLSGPQSQQLMKQLLYSSVDCAFSGGVSGITGPAARQDDETIAIETAFLASCSGDLAALYTTFTTLIKQAVNDGHLL